MAKMMDMLQMGAMLFIGVIALKAFGGIKGITGMFEGIGDLFGAGGSAGAGGVVYGGTGGIITPGVIEDVVESGGTVDIVETAPHDPFNPLALLSPFGTIAEYMRYLSQQPGETTTTITGDTGGTTRVVGGNGTYTPSPEPYYQPSPIVPADPGHPATDPFIGGR